MIIRRYDMDRDVNAEVLASLERMSGSAAIAKAVQQSLRRLADGAAGTELAELAHDILAGRVDPQRLTTSEVYAEPLRHALAGFRDWYAALEPAERERMIAEARTQLDGAGDPA
jgi:hypothetical protein